MKVIETEIEGLEGVETDLWLVGSRGNCRGDECEASIYSKAYTEGSDPLGPRGEKTTVVIYCGNQVWPCWPL